MSISSSFSMIKGLAVSCPHEVSYFPIWQSPMHCAVRYIFTYTLGTGVAHIFAKLSAVEQGVRHSKELHRLYDRGTQLFRAVNPTFCEKLSDKL